MVVQKTVDPDGSSLKPEDFFRIQTRAVVIQAAYDAAVFVVESVLIPEREKNLKELVVKPLTQLRKTHACQPHLRRRPGHGGSVGGLSMAVAGDTELKRSRSNQFNECTSFHFSDLLSVFSSQESVSSRPVDSSI